MEINRNQYLLLGIVILLLGLQVRWVDSYVLNDRASRFVAERMAQASSEGEAAMRNLMPSLGINQRRTVKPPTWLGYALMSTGAVLILHSLAMKKPGG